MSGVVVFPVLGVAVQVPGGHPCAGAIDQGMVRGDIGVGNASAGCAVGAVVPASALRAG